MDPGTFIQTFPYKIILGSASPRRQELLRSLGFSFEVKSMNVDEDGWPAHLRAEEICIHLAEKKAAAYTGLKADEFLITSDTIVWCEGRVYNKPVDESDGLRMLRELGGKMHQVFTAVTLRTATKQHSFYDESKVYFRHFTDDEIRFYLRTYKPFDKAGAYGVQDWLGYVGIEKIEGSFYNVMGLPLARLWEEMNAF